MPDSKTDPAMKALAVAAQTLSDLLRYQIDKKWLGEEEAKCMTLNGLNEVVKAMGEIERLF